MSTTPTRTTRRVLGRAVAVLAAGLLAGVATASGAAAAPSPADVGWVRLAHLSPDTPEVDIQLTNVATSDTQEFSDVGYADVSGYQRLSPGSYTVAMRPAGAPASSDPVITQAVDVSGGQAYTVAAVGLNENLAGRVITDDLEAPPAGQARVRLIQASVSQPEVDVTTDTGDPIATDAAFGSVTGYASIDAGAWTLDVSGATRSGVVDVDLAPGSVNTLFALDQGGQLTIASVVDSEGAGTMPDGGVATGGGGLYYEQQRHQAIALGALGLLVVTGSALLIRSSRRRAEDAGAA
jgi:hypothetical protein